MENVTRKEAAKILGIHPTNVSNLIRRNELQLDEKNKVVYESIEKYKIEMEERRKIKPPVWVVRVTD